ncbi:MAG: HNH endonuclease [Candidatus Aureabacteria bacterium]|nr:HNH endonuclease [Candidatus Auribacterota bacterium]
MTSVRKEIPARTFKVQYSSYRQYKEPLRRDFNKRCGYCDDIDHHCNGKKGYHIDHFRPKNSFPELSRDYSNLVYSCPYCNGGKGADWPAGNSPETFIGDEGYIDPCLSTYDNHFARSDDGSIKPLTKLGQYIFKKLNLGLRRHKLICMLEILEGLLKQIGIALENNKDYDLLNKQSAVIREYLLLQEHFRATL